MKQKHGKFPLLDSLVDCSTRNRRIHTNSPRGNGRADQIRQEIEPRRTFFFWTILPVNMGACISLSDEGLQGRFAPLAPGLLPSAAHLSPLQRQAAESLLSSKDQVCVFRGGAGTGKSTTLAPVRDALEAAAKNVVTLAPQNEQVLGLQADGFKAQTVASFLTGPSQLDANSVVIVDEAGLIGGEDMASLLAKAKMSGARVLLSGDTRQKTAVARSDALRAIERYAKPHVAELSGEKAIHRQKVADYRKAVACAERGDTGQS